MRKICLILCFILLTTLYGCNKKTTSLGTAQKSSQNPLPTLSVTPSGVSKSHIYKDGTYKAYGDKWKYGQESAMITVKKGRIVYVTLSRLDTTGKEVNYNDWTGQKTANGIKPNLKKDRLVVASSMVKNQTYAVDTVAGATVSTSGWKLAAQRALEKAK